MPLTVLRNSMSFAWSDMVRLFHQSQLEWSRHLGEEIELNFGRWISNPDLAESNLANCLLDAYLLADLSANQVIEEMNAKRQRWRLCSLNPSLPEDRTVPLGTALDSLGWTAKPIDILYRSKRIGPALVERSDLTIIPARASYRHYRELMNQRADEALLHLDDSHFDALLALQAGKAVGCVGVLTSGEVGTVQEWYVSAERRGQGIGRLLLDRALEICARSVLRHVMIGLDPGNEIAQGLCTEFGFEIIGQWKAFESPISLA